MRTNLLRLVGRWTSEFLIFVLTLFVLLPIFLTVLGAFKNEKEAAELALAFPTQWIWSNVTNLLFNVKFKHALVNSVVYTVVGVAISLLVNSLCAYILARRVTKFTHLIYYVFVAGLIIPPFVIPQIRVMQQLHLMNTFSGTILLFVCGSIPFSIFLFTGFIKTISATLDEAAFVDGSGPIRTFFQIIFPLLQPVAVTLGIFVAIGIWNDFQVSLYFIRSPENQPVTMWLYKNVSQHSTQWSLVFASMLLVMTPLILVYAFAQKYIVEGLTAGAVK